MVNVFICKNVFIYVYYLCFSAVGDLTAFSKQTEHYVAEHGFDSFLFVPASRPEFVNDVYQVADVNPVHVIRRCNIYRTDGKTGSKIFSVPSVFQDEKDNIMSEMEDKQVDIIATQLGY